MILYELLTGRPPYRGETMLETLRLVREQEPARPRLLNSRIAADLETIVLKCLEKAPSRRYHSAEAVAEDLDRWLDHLPIRARPSTVPERLIKWARRRPWAAALLAVGIVAVASSSLAVLGLVSAARLQGVVHSKGLALEKAETELDRTRENALRIEEDQYFHGLLAAEQALASHNPDQAGRAARGVPTPAAKLGVATPDATTAFRVTSAPRTLGVPLRTRLRAGCRQGGRLRDRRPPGLDLEHLDVS